MIIIKVKTLKVGENRYFKVISTAYLKGGDNKMRCSEAKTCIFKRGLRKRQFNLLKLNKKQTPQN